MGGFVAEDAMKDVHADVQKHAKRVSCPHKTRSKAPAEPVDHPESIVEEPHSADIAPAFDRSHQPGATPPRAAASSGNRAQEVEKD